MAPTRIVCIGCGPTIIGVTHHLHQLIQQGKLSADDVQVTVLERFDGPGGLAGSIIDEKGFAWDLGGHVHGEPSKYECFQQALLSLPCQWNMIRRAAKAGPQMPTEFDLRQCDMRPIYGERNTEADASEDHTTYVPYPVQLSVPLFPPELRQQCIEDIRAAQAVEHAQKPANFDEWCSRLFGSKLKEVWTVGLEEMNSVWVGERVAAVDVDQLAELADKSRQQLLKHDLGWGPNTFFRYPAAGRGCSATWQLMTAEHPADWYRFAHDVTAIDSSTKTVTAEHAGAQVSFAYDHLISSMPITLLCDMLSVPRPNVRHSKVALIGVGVHKPQSTWAHQVTWAYYPADDIPFYRCTFLSNYNTVMTPDSDKYWSLLLEVGYQPHEQFDEKDLVDRCIKGLVRAEVIEGESAVSHVWYKLLPFGYPIPTVERDAELTSAHRALEAASVYSRGRFGGWKYEVANMDHSFAQGWELVDRILYGTPETVYKTGLQ